MIVRKAFPSERCRLTGILLCLCLARLAIGQFNSAAVLDTITDSSGAVIAGAKVTLNNVKTGIRKPSTGTARA